MSDGSVGGGLLPMGAEDSSQVLGATSSRGDTAENTDDTRGTKDSDKDLWRHDYGYYDYGVEYGGQFSDREFYSSHSEGGLLYGEDTEHFPFWPYYPPEEEEEDMKTILRRTSSTVTPECAEAAPPSTTPQDQHRRSVFVHSSPSHFPDVNVARNSVFGSIFLRTTGQAAEDATLLKTVVDSSYSMLHSLLNSYERIAVSDSSDIDRKQMAMAYKASLLKALESHGISRTHSDGSIHWNIYPVAHDYLFSVQVGNHIHQTRLLSKIEDRVVLGSTQKPRFPYVWPTDSVWSGHWDALGMAGVGTYVMPHGVSYNGKMQNGRFHDDNATLTYPNKFKALHCVFVRGKMVSCQFQYPDLLMHEKENWGYCKFPDRRFWSEVRHGLKPAKIAQKTEIDPPRKIPEGCYDTSDGFYNPKSLMLVSPAGELLRVPVCEEDIWIKQYCRKGFRQPADFRPDLFENWYNYDYDLIHTVLKAQSKYRAGKITYEELQLIYADLNLLPSWSKYKKRKTPSEIAMEERLNIIEEPKKIEKPRMQEEKYKGHKIPSYVLEELKKDSKEKLNQEDLKNNAMKTSKSNFRFQQYSKMKMGSKISFRIGQEEKEDSVSLGFQSEKKRKIPEKYLKYQPILKLPFERNIILPESSKRKKCQEMESPSVSSESEIWGEFLGESYAEELKQKNLRKFMKEIIMEKVNEILLEERERHRRRLKWGKEVPQKSLPRERKGEKCLKVLEELFDSIPDKEEYCDSYPNRTCDLKKLAEDKYQMLQYWGKRMYTLKFVQKKDEMDEEDD